MDRACHMRRMRRHYAPRMGHGPDTHGRPHRFAGVGFAIVLASIAVTLAAMAPGCAREQALDPAVGSTLDSYFEGFKTEDATKVLSVVGAELRGTMSPLPEETAKQLRKANERYGGVQEWAVQDGDVDDLNGQALVTVRVTSTKAIHIVLMDLRMEEGEWKVYGIEDKDAVRNPDYDRSIPGDIGRDNPFKIR